MNIALRTCTSLLNILTLPSRTRTLKARAFVSQLSVPSESESRPSVFAASTHFIRQNCLKFLAISALVVVPCLWHRRIIAGDLASHTYNAWLAQLIEHGQVSGLWIERRWNNVLFDLLLSGLGKVLSLHAAEKIAVSVAVLIFFWGMFAFVSAAGERAPWFLVPVIAM